MNTEYWYQIDKGSKMFDFEEQYERFANELPDKCVVAEVGVSNGKSALFLASKLTDLRKSYQLEMIDNLDYGKEVQMKEIMKNIIASGLENINFVPKDSLNASCLYPDELFDLIFLDSSHEYQATKAEIRCWLHKIKTGGILAGHDANYEDGVGKAIREVIPEELLHIENTKHNWGMWWFIKTEKMKL
jgi:predicted O-methyltransferase YrrM